MIMARPQASESAIVYKQGRGMLPTVDLTTCSRCGGCIELAPEIFRFSESGGYIEVCDLDHYDEAVVDEAIMFCPEDSIRWESEYP
jgi:ferredoxin